MIEKREPWPLDGQFAACGLDTPAPHRDGWAFKRAKLFVHICAAKTCAPCAEAARAGWESVRVTKDDVLTGRALAAVAGILWRRGPTQGGLF